MKPSLTVIQGEGQSEEQAKRAVSALMRGELELFEAINLTIPTQPTLTSIAGGKETRSLPPTPRQSSADKT